MLGRGCRGAGIGANPPARGEGRLSAAGGLPHIARMNKTLLLAAGLMLCPALLSAQDLTTVRPQEKPEIRLAEAADAVSPAAPVVDAPALAESGARKPVEGNATTALLNPATGRPPARSGQIPRTRWQHKRGHAVWTRAALSALKGHGQPLVAETPEDIDYWCPAYRDAPAAQRRAFWVGFLSALAKHESTYKAHAVGGGGKWYGLLQILPATARGYGCNVGTGGGLQNGAANLSCAVRIMAVTVPRDGLIYGRGGRGVAADWGPMRNARKRVDMANWLKRQNYCKPLNATRPRARSDAAQPTT